MNWRTPINDRVLARGFDHAEIKAAYERAKASGSYDKVERWFGNGRQNTKWACFDKTERKVGAFG